MRPILYLLLITISFGCSKEKDLSIPAQLSGKWELRRTFSGFSNATTIYPVGNGNRYEFTKTHFFRFDNGSLVEDGTYEIVADTAWQGRRGDRIIYNGNRNPSVPMVFVKIEGDKLYFSLQAIDGGGNEFQRIQ